MEIERSVMADRSNKALNDVIEAQIDIWDGTVHGYQIKNAWKNGCDYETMCKLCGLEYEEYEQEE